MTRVAVVGGGAWGKNLVRNMRELGALAAVCDVSEALLEHYGKLYPDLLLTTQFEAILRDQSIGQVMIATPAPTHFPLAKQALHAGKDVYIEKPLTLSVAEGEELTALAASRGAILMVGHILQYHPCVIKLLEMIRGGELGETRYLASHRLNLGKIEQGENVLWALAPHDISVLLAACGPEMPHMVCCQGVKALGNERADIAWTTLHFEKGLFARIYVSWLNPYKEQRLVVVGTRGLLVFDDTLPWAEKLQLQREPTRIDERGVLRENPAPKELIHVEQREPLKEECLHFLTCCRDRTTPRTDGNEAIRVLSVLEAANASMKEDGVPFEPKGL